MRGRTVAYTRKCKFGECCLLFRNRSRHTRISLRRNITLTQIFYNRISAWIHAHRVCGQNRSAASEREQLQRPLNTYLSPRISIEGDTKFSIGGEGRFSLLQLGFITVGCGKQTIDQSCCCDAFKKICIQERYADFGNPFSRFYRTVTNQRWEAMIIALF